MAKDINQGVIIRHLNSYFKASNMPLVMNRDDICHGLCAVNAKYISECKEKEFYQILDYISTGKQNPDISEDDINHFAVEILLPFSPHNYEKQFAQSTALNMLSVDGEKL